MSWINNLLPPKIQEGKTKSNVPEGKWCKCINCNEILFYTDLDHNHKVCPKCSHHHPLSARERVDLLLDLDNRTEFATNIKPLDILDFVDSKKYSERIKLAQETIKEDDALIVFKGLINGQKVILACFEFKFIGGSMGSVVGEKFVQGVKAAIKERIPFICVASSGGARMQEGVNSLMQMTKTCAILTQLSSPFISILTNPTMGGVSASFAFLGDIVIAEPGALIGFAGPRVIEQTVREKLPQNFQSSEFLLEKGAIDMVVSRAELKDEVSKILSILANKTLNRLSKS